MTSSPTFSLPTSISAQELEWLYQETMWVTSCFSMAESNYKPHGAANPRQTPDQVGRPWRARPWWRPQLNLILHIIWFPDSHSFWRFWNIPRYSLTLNLCTWSWLQLCPISHRSGQHKFHFLNDATQTGSLLFSMWAALFTSFIACHTLCLLVPCLSVWLNFKFCNDRKTNFFWLHIQHQAVFLAHSWCFIYSPSTNE